KRFMGTTAQIGFHAAFVVRSGQASETGVGNAPVGAYLNKIGLPDRAIVYITQSSPEEMTWLSRSEAQQRGIDVALFTPDNSNVTTDLKRPSIKPPTSNPASLREQTPATYKVRFDTTKGPFVVEVTRAWAPRGADRFYNLVKNGFYDNVRFSRVISGFMVQFGINSDPAIMANWRTAQIPDDPVTQSN